VPVPAPSQHDGNQGSVCPRSLVCPRRTPRHKTTTVRAQLSKPYHTSCMTAGRHVTCPSTCPSRRCHPAACVGACSEGGLMIGNLCMEREHRTPTYPATHPLPPRPLTNQGYLCPLEPLAASTSLATSPPRTSPHARPLVSTATPTLPPTRRGQLRSLRDAPRSEPEPRTVRVLRFTPAPAPSCACRCSRGGRTVRVGVVVKEQLACRGAVLGPLSCCECV
jgi:hypothetical protein